MAELIIRQLGLQSYAPILDAMRRYTDQRDAASADEIRLLEHEPVFTQGQTGKAEHLLAPGDIPVVQVERGGQVTYHGPGQLVVYLLLDLKRLKIGVRELVSLMEDAVVAVLAQHGVAGYPKPDAPGVYVAGDKIASLGLRVRRGCSFHGLALNVCMDLEPFLRINPCGYAGLKMTQLSTLAAGVSMTQVRAQLQQYLSERLGYNSVLFSNRLDG